MSAVLLNDSLYVFKNANGKNSKLEISFLSLLFFGHDSTDYIIIMIKYYVISACISIFLHLNFQHSCFYFLCNNVDLREN